MRRWIELLFLILFALPVVTQCVSKTIPDQRFADSAALNFTPPTVTPANPQNFTFAMVGDLHIAAGDTSRLSTILSMAKAESDSFIILLGDLVDQGDQADFAAYQAAIAGSSFSAAAFSVIGNHDVFYDGWNSFKTLLGPSHYTFTVGNSKFIVLDTADGSVGGTQLRWLEDQLSGPQPANVFLLSHYLPIVPGIRTYLKFSDEREATYLMKLAVTHQVRGWYGGHYHSFAVGNADGVDYVVAGGGGGRRMDPVTAYFFVQVSVAGTQVQYQLRVLP